MIWVVIIISLLLGIIVVMSWQPWAKPKTQGEFLKDLCELVNGKIEPVPDKENAYRIVFVFDNEEFTYEEFEALTFRDKVIKAILKVKTPIDFNLVFVVRKAQTVVISAYQDMPMKADKNIALPPALSGFEAKSDQPHLAESLLKEVNVTKILTEYKHVDSHGHLYMPLRIVDGFVSLEFIPQGNMRPSLIALRRDPNSIEHYLEQFLTLVQGIRKYKQEQEESKGT